VANLKTTKIALAFAAVLAFGIAQDPPKPDPSKKVAKDQAEADLINSLPKETDGNKRLQILDKWSKDYPETAFTNERQEAYRDIYQQLNKPREAFNKSVEILQRDPDNFDSLRDILVDVFQLGNPPPAADLDTAEKAANHLLKDADTIFVAGKKPIYMNDGQWAQTKDPMKIYAQRTIAVIYVQRKDNAKAEVELKKAFDMQPKDSQVAQMLAGSLLAQQQADPKKTPIALFYYARAAGYDGEGALPPANRTQLQGFLKRAYTTYHGSDEGLDKLLAMAKTSTSPDNLHIDSTVDIAAATAAKAAADAAADPAMAMWKTVKEGLTGASPDAFFDGSVKDALLPGKNPTTGTELKFKGKLVSLKPALRPKTLVLAVQSPEGDVTLNFEMPLPGKMDVGTELEFEGTVKSYTKEPFMLTMESEKEQISGWKPVAPTPAPKKAVPAKKKAQ
jgi:hypothetical protein